jgi:hypothetical protein
MASTGSSKLLIGSVVLTLAIYVIPFGHYIGYPLVLLSTLAHEMGHGIAGVLVGREFVSLQLYSDGSGMASTAGSPSALRGAIVSAGGLVGPAVVAAGLFALAKSRRVAKIALAMIGLALIITDALVVRNIFGFAFIGITGLACLYIARDYTADTARFAIVFVATQLALSVFSRADYLFMNVAQTASGPMPSDVAQIAEALWLPYWVWGGLCGGFSVLVLALGVRSFLRE